MRLYERIRRMFGWLTPHPQQDAQPPDLSRRDDVDEKQAVREQLDDIQARLMLLNVRHEGLLHNDDRRDVQ